jgi:hypothetical protein
MKDVSTTIKGQQYRLIKLDPLRGGRLATRVAQHLAGALDDVKLIEQLIKSQIGNADKEAAEPQDDKQGMLAKLMDAPQLLSAMAGGIGKVDGEALFDCGIECIRGNLFAASKLHDDTAINQWFGDHPDHLLLVLVWALKENCKGFFGFGGQS